jgi:uncharacterized protein (TIGR04255 family)
MLPDILGRWFTDRSEINTAPPYAMTAESPAIQGPWIGIGPIELQPNTIEPRYWITLKDNAYVIQVQRDYLALNWRRRHVDEEYVHYDTLRQRFADLLSVVEENLSAAGELLGPERAELTYVNVIEPNQLWETPSQTHRLFAFHFSDEDDYEQVTAAYSKSMRDPGGVFLGRVHVSLQPSIDWAKEQPRLNLSLVARSSKLAESTSGQALSFLDAAHISLNQTFSRLLTDDAARQWGIE